MGALLANWSNYEGVPFTACVLPKVRACGPYVDENLAFFFKMNLKLL